MGFVGINIKNIIIHGYTEYNRMERGPNRIYAGLALPVMRMIAQRKSTLLHQHNDTQDIALLFFRQIQFTGNLIADGFPCLFHKKHGSNLRAFL